MAYSAGHFVHHLPQTSAAWKTTIDESVADEMERLSLSMSCVQPHRLQGFFGCPREIRDMIYGFLWGHTPRMRIRKRTKARDQGPSMHASIGPLPSYTLNCQFTCSPLSYSKDAYANCNHCLKAEPLHSRHGFSQTLKCSQKVWRSSDPRLYGMSWN